MKDLRQVEPTSYPALIGEVVERLRRRASAIAVVAVAACLLLAPGTAAAGTLDQQQLDDSGIIVLAHSTSSIAQTFTAGLSGGLDQADLNLATSGSPSADLNVQIRDASGTGPGNQVLASNSIPASGVPGSHAFVQVGFNPPAPVVAGQQYAIVVYSATAFPNSYGWYGSAADPYPSGSAFTNGVSPPSGSWNSRSDDRAFRTFVVVAASPTASAPTGQRAAAIKKCKKKFPGKANARKRKRCIKKAKKLPA